MEGNVTNVIYEVVKNVRRETRRNTWKYQEIKSMPHYKVYTYANRLLKPSCPSAPMDVISK